MDLEAGDLVALYTDGITEAVDAAGEEFGSERLMGLLRDHRGRDLADISRTMTRGGCCEEELT